MKSEIFVKNNKGVTLIEAVIAILIAAITLTGFLQVCSMSAFILQSIKYRMRAVNIAQAEIEDLKAETYSDIVSGVYQTDIIIDEGPSSSSDDDIVGQLQTTIKNVTNAPLQGKKVIIEVSWELLGESKRDILETVIYSHL